MPRNITTAGKYAWDFHKSDGLAQTNQICMTACFLHGTESTKKFINSRSKIRNKNPRHAFYRFYIVL